MKSGFQTAFSVAKAAANGFKATVETVVSAVQGIATAASKVASAASTAFSKMGDAAQNIGSRLQSAGDAISGLGGKITAVETAAAGLATAGLKKAADSAIDFDTQMRKVGGILGYSAEEMQTFQGDMKALQDTALELGASTSLSSSEVAEAMTEMAAKGADANEIIADMPGIISAAEASGEDLALVADTVSNVLIHSVTVLVMPPMLPMYWQNRQTALLLVYPTCNMHLNMLLRLPLQWESAWKNWRLPLVSWWMPVYKGNKLVRHCVPCLFLWRSQQTKQEKPWKNWGFPSLTAKAR